VTHRHLLVPHLSRRIFRAATFRAATFRADCIAAIGEWRWSMARCRRRNGKIILKIRRELSP